MYLTTGASSTSESSSVLAAAGAPSENETVAGVGFLAHGIWDAYHYRAGLVVTRSWAQFCAAHDKQKIYVETRKMLEKAIHRGEKPVVARFYLGRVERMLGRDQDALRHFREVLEQAPGHTEAASELRVLESRLSGRKR